MKPVLVAFATREGQTRKIAEHVAATIRARGDQAELLDLGSGARVELEPTAYAAVVLAASVHVGKHEREMVDFVKRYHEELERLPTAFLSVSLSEAGVEDMTATFEARSKAAVDVKRMIDDFCHQTGFHPSRVWPVAGALMYSEYGALVRFVMRRIARHAGQSTDTTHDHEYTDWKGLHRFVDALMTELEEESDARPRDRRQGVATREQARVSPPSQAR
ncbi:MAG TPA: flavodoxin domain-containing protein [Polyangiaceae bacterium]